MTNEFYEEIVGQDDSAAWLEARKSGIGASEIACVLGVSPWGSALSLFAQKTGQMEPPNLEENEAVFWGNALEEAIIDGYAKRTGRLVKRFAKLIRSKRWPWMLCTPDALTSDDGGKTWWPLQIKNIGFNSADHWQDGAPEYYRVQVTQEALVFGASKCTAAALVAGQKLVWEDVEVDEILKRKIVNLGGAFWEDHVVKCVAPRADGSDSARAALAALYPRETPGMLAQLPATLLDVDAELLQVKQKQAELDERRSELEIQIKEALKDAEAGILPDGTRYTFKAVNVGPKQMAGYSFRKLTRKAPKEARE